MKHIFVVNPYAGKGNRVDKLLVRIQSVCEARQLDYTIHITSSVGDAERYIRMTCIEHSESGTPLRFYACGGDGTVNECINGVYGFSFAEVTVIPIGTGNDFVRNFGGEQAFLDVEALVESNAYPIDLIKYNDRYCANIINIGFDCAVVAQTNKLKTSPLIPSKLAYIFGLVIELVRKSGVRFHCVADGEDMGEKKLLLSLFANGCYYGGGFYSAPKADLHDGLLDMCFIRYVTRLRFISLVGSYKKGVHLGIRKPDRFFHYQKCRNVEITFSAPQQICVDGELETCEKLHLTMVRDAVKFVVPKMFEQGAKSL